MRPLLIFILLSIECLALSGVFNSKERYFVDGSYTTERKLLHEKIVQKFMRVERFAAWERPTFILAIGGPASGKSTTIAQLEEAGIINLESFVRADADAIKEELPEYKIFQSESVKLAETAVHAESVDIRLQILKQASSAKRSIFLDTAATKEKPTGQMFASLYNVFLEYNFILLHLEATADVMVARAHQRVESNKRFFRKESVLSGRQNALVYFKQLLPLADLAIQIETTEAPSLIVRQINDTRNECERSFSSTLLPGLLRLIQ